MNSFKCWLLCQYTTSTILFVCFFQVDDQMKLLHVSWSEMLMLDHIYQHCTNGLPDETRLLNGQKFNLVNMCLFGFTSMTDRLEELFRKMRQLKFDRNDYVCLKFLILMNPGKICHRMTVLFDVAVFKQSCINTVQLFTFVIEWQCLFDVAAFKQSCVNTVQLFK